MKVILSRKGMDASYGGIPSPVIQSERAYRFYSLPIPFEQSDITYSEVKLFGDYNAWDFIRDVSPNFEKKYPAKTCHLDPDIREGYLHSRPKGWQRAFGQVNQAQSHLEKHGIGKGDIFLFWGWFQFAELKEGKFAYKPTLEHPNGFHAIYGYLQVHEIFKPNESEVPDWLKEHPHVIHKDQSPFNKSNNTIYTSDKYFRHGDTVIKVKGSSCFDFNESLILTKKGSKKRTIWELPFTFHPGNGVTLTYNIAKNWSFSKKIGKAESRSASRGQEFVFSADPEGAVEEWCIDLIKSNCVTY
jgi:hypothetical protein